MEEFPERRFAVPYTHLTLPTIRNESMCGVAGAMISTEAAVKREFDDYWSGWELLSVHKQNKAR